MYTGVIKLLQHKMDEATKNKFKNELEYLINFDIEQVIFIINIKVAICDRVSDSNERKLLKNLLTKFKEIPQLAQIIFEAFDRINFNFDDLIREVKDFNTDIENFRSYFTILSPSYQISDLISANFYLSNFIQNLKNINKIVDLTFSN